MLVSERKKLEVMSEITYVMVTPERPDERKRDKEKLRANAV